MFHKCSSQMLKPKFRVNEMGSLIDDRKCKVCCRFVSDSHHTCLHDIWRVSLVDISA